jgi:hypothetical protein
MFCPYLLGGAIVLALLIYLWVKPINFIWYGTSSPNRSSRCLRRLFKEEVNIASIVILMSSASAEF